MSGWGKQLASIWTNNVAPSRPSCSELCIYTHYLRELQAVIQRPVRLLILGSTPEFRDWGFEENLRITVVDKSPDYYKQISQEIRHKHLKERLVISEWESMQFSEDFDMIIGDLAIGNVNPARFDDFLDCIQCALSDDGIFIGKSFLWNENEPVKTPLQIVSEYRTSNGIHPYTFINHQLGLYCLDRQKQVIDFSKMYSEMCKLLESGAIDYDLFSFFQNVGWNTEMKFVFFSPSQSYFISKVNEKLQFVEFTHSSDIYSNVFPIYVIKKKGTV